MPSSFVFGRFSNVAVQPLAAFSVTLPGFWKGNYTCARDDNGMVFSFTGDGAEPAELFSFTLVKWEDVLDAINSAVVYGEYLRGDERLYLVVSAMEETPDD